ncbi:MAG: dissimilatory-type sulfite reductase subunit alpha [Thermoproteus sp.]|nr:dissimilatory-type sulfite reductase subunit alpha [Thermoproteus sp.]
MAAPPNLPPADVLLKRAEEMLGELEKGPWPSHVTELKKTKYPLKVYGVGLAARKSPWGPSAVKVSYVNTGVLARVAREWVPGGGEEVHFRVFHTPGKFWTTDFARKLAKIAKEHGVGLLELVGQTGAFVINLTKDKAEDMVDVLREIGTDVGGSGDAIRALNACVGPALCEFALFDTLRWYAEFHKDKRVNDAIATPGFPYKFKIKFSGCPMDCARANRGDVGFIGVFERHIIDQELLRKKIEAGEVKPEELVARCPARAISWDPKTRTLSIDKAKCKKSMECIRRAFPAIRPDKSTAKVAVVVGGGSKGRYGPKLGWFIGYTDPGDPKKAIDLVFKMIEPWDKEAQPKYRVGDYILVVGLDKYLEKAEVKLEGMPFTKSKLPDDVPYTVLPKEERNKYLEFAQKLREGIATKEAAGAGQ